MKNLKLLLLLGMLSLAAWPGRLRADTDTPTATISATFTVTPTITPTYTVTPTVTPSATNAPPVEVVTLNHNRFNPQASETVSILHLRPDHGQVSVKVYNAAGVLIREVLNRQVSGFETVDWDGKNEQGETVASGVYYIMVTGNRLHKRLRIAVIK